MINSGNILRTARRIFSRILGTLVILVLASTLYLSTVGFPDWLVAKVTGRTNAGSFVLNAGSMKLDPLRGFVVNDVRFYRKGVVGPPAVDAEQVVLTIDPLAVMENRICLKKIKVIEGVFRPGMARGRGPFTGVESDVKMRLRLELYQCEVQGLHVEKLSCEFRADGSNIMFKDVKAVLSRDDLREPELTGDVTYSMNTGVLDGHLVTLLDPRVLLPVLEASATPFTAKLVKRFDFRETTPPRCEVAFRKPRGTNAFFSLEGKFWLEDCTYNGVDILRGDGRVNLDLSATNSTMTISQLFVFREEGLVKGDFTVDLRRQVVNFNGMSTMNPVLLAQMIGPFTDKVVRRFRFEGPVKIMANGVVGYRDSGLRDIEATVESRGLGALMFVSDECSFALHVSGVTNTLSDIRGEIYGGDFTGSVRLVLPSGTSTNTRYMAEGEIRNAELEKLAAAMMKEPKRDYCGRLSARVKVEGLMGKGMGSTALGEGNASIKDGRIFTFPFFGGFTDIMSKIIPGLNFVLSQTDAKGAFKISHGEINTDKVLIEGGLFSVNIRGSYYLNKDLNFKLRVNLFKSKTLWGKTVHTILHPLSWLLEFRLRGTLDNPQWSATNFSVSDLLKAVGLKDKE